MNAETFDASKFSDLIAANTEYAQTFKYSELTGSAARGLAIVTCMIHVSIHYRLLVCAQEMPRFCVTQEPE